MRTPLFLTALEIETLLGFVGELLDDASPIDNANRTTLDGIYTLLSEVA